MPSLQVDIPGRMAAEAKRRLAKKMGMIYSEVMEVRPDIITVSVHDLGEGGIWRCTDGDPVPAALLMCDVRSGRPPQTRAALAQQLVEVVASEAGLHPHSVKVEFTQHSGDEMYHPHLGGFNKDWSGDESGRSLDGTSAGTPGA